MIDFLVLAAGASSLGREDGGYPSCLTEIDNIPLIEHLIRRFQPLAPRRIIFALRDDDIRQFGLDETVHMLVPDARILRVREGNGRAACTALLACDHVDPAAELLVLNVNELIDAPFDEILGAFRAAGHAAGVVTFPSVHPRYSYVRLDEAGLVIEAAEKRAISRHATAGFYWFARAADFFAAAQRMIRKGAGHNGLFYVCPSLNELVLEGKQIGAYAIPLALYHPLKSERQLQSLLGGE